MGTLRGNDVKGMVACDLTGAPTLCARGALGESSARFVRGTNNLDPPDRTPSERTRHAAQRAAQPERQRRDGRGLVRPVQDAARGIARGPRAHRDQARVGAGRMREALALAGTKPGCERGECGSCGGLVEGEPQLSCLVLAVE